MKVRQWPDGGDWEDAGPPDGLTSMWKPLPGLDADSTTAWYIGVEGDRPRLERDELVVVVTIPELRAVERALDTSGDLHELALQTSADIARILEEIDG